MKRIIFGFLLLACFITIQAQQEEKDMLSPKAQNIEKFKLAKEDMIVKELGLTEKQETEFRALYKEYDRDEVALMKSFRGGMGKPTENNLTDQQAKEKIYESFVIGQKLLDNKKMYAEKFLKIISPNQLLKMFQTERMIHHKLREKEMGRKESPKP